MLSMIESAFAIQALVWAKKMSNLNQRYGLGPSCGQFWNRSNLVVQIVRKA